MFLSLRMHARHWSNPLGRYFFQGQTKTTDQASDPDAPNQTTGPQPHRCGGRRRDRRARLWRPWVVAGPGRAHQNHRHRRCGGRRRDRRTRASLQTRGLAAVPVGGGRARAGLEIDHSEPQARVWRSRGRAAAHRHTQRPGPSRQALRRPEHQRRHKQQHAGTNGERAGRRPPAHTAARPFKADPPAPGTPAAPHATPPERGQKESPTAPGMP